MSYVQANTQNPLGRRNLGRGLGRMGWDNAPYPVYQQPRSMTQLNGETTNTGGAITYRIDPRTGRYNFYRTDIKPRGVFLQNTFQHPAPPLMSPLGLRMSGGLSGLACNGCGGRCNSSLSGPRRRRRRGMGEADFPGACGPQSDGTIIPCPRDASMATEQGDVSLPGVTPKVIAPAPGTTIETVINVQRPPAVQPASWFDQSTSIGGARVSNPVLAAGAVGFAFLLAGMGKGRR